MDKGKEKGHREGGGEVVYGINILSLVSEFHTVSCLVLLAGTRVCEGSTRASGPA